MKKIGRYLKSYLFYVELLTAATIVSAFIPALNPLLAYGDEKKHALFSIFMNLGDIEKYFESVLSSFSFFSKILFVMMLLFYVGMVCYVCGLILVWAKGQGGRQSILTGSIVFLMVYLVFFIVYFSINRELLYNGSDTIRTRFAVWSHIPLGIYYHFLLAVGVLVLSTLESGVDFKALWYRLRLNWIHRFEGGVHPDSCKETRSKPIETLPPQKEMIYPMLQHIGAMCEPCVKVGDYVRIGQKIGDSNAAVSCPIHATVSGTVKKIADWDHPIANRIPAVVVENDFEDKRAECFMQACADYQSKTPGELIAMIREAGVVGMGGAGFPTHIKLTGGIGRVDTLVVNAAECEPYLSSDHRVILENIDDLLSGIKIVRYITSAKNVLIGIENNKPDAISLLHKRLSKSTVRVVILKTKYPQGGEKQLIRAVCGRVVPSGMLPTDAGCLVMNVDTLIAIHRAVVNGSPLLRRIVTVAGNGVERSGNVNVRIGTPFSAVLQYFGYKNATRKLIMGGPMMGIAQYSTDAPVIKNTSGLLCFTKDQLSVDRDAGCIHCGSCVQACPMHLVPNYIAQAVRADRFERARELHVADCIECGCCSFTCPAKIPLIQYMRIGKQRVGEMKSQKAGGKNCG